MYLNFFWINLNLSRRMGLLKNVSISRSKAHTDPSPSSYRPPSPDVGVLLQSFSVRETAAGDCRHDSSTGRRQVIEEKTEWCWCKTSSLPKPRHLVHNFLVSWPFRLGSMLVPFFIFYLWRKERTNSVVNFFNVFAVSFSC